MRPLALAVLVLAASAVASAQRAPRMTRADFESAALDRAASTALQSPCAEDDGPRRTRTLTRAERVQVLGRVLPLPDGRAVALVRTATNDADANGELAYALHVLVLARGAGGLESASVAIDVGEARFQYDAPVVVIARLEDVDDDGERELFLVLDTNTETTCGPGYCTVRRSVIVDLGVDAISVTANVASRITCQADTAPEERGTVLLRDVDGDGHRDLVHRQRLCPGDEEGADGAWITPPCEPPREHVRLWRVATDDYAPP